MAEPNSAQAHHWNFDAGPGWVARQEQLDRMLEPLGERGLATASALPGERAIDIGCGCGATTIALARQVGESGRVLGVDISEPMLARARERCAELRLANVELMRSDAQQAQLPPGHDLAFSRFGVMFFDDPTAAMANIRRGLDPGGRLVFVCWQDRSRNPWMGIPMAAALQHVPTPPALPPDAPGPFAFADPDRVRGILTDAGFADIALDAVDHELLVGGASDLDGAAEFAADSGSVRSVLGAADGDTRRRAAESIRIALAPHAGPDGVRLASAVWVVSARKAGA
jgi:SAM-dependent methyltransferase